MITGNLTYLDYNLVRLLLGKRQGLPLENLKSTGLVNGDGLNCA